MQRACLELVKQGLSHPDSGGAQFSVLAARSEQLAVSLMEAVSCGLAMGGEHTVLTCRARQASNEEFSRWVQRLAVDGAAWDTRPAYTELQSEVDSHIDRLVTSKVCMYN